MECPGQSQINPDISFVRKMCRQTPKNIRVSCTASSSSRTIEDIRDSKIKISVRPNEEAKFSFVIHNDTVDIVIEAVAVCFLNSTFDMCNQSKNDQKHTLLKEALVLKPKMKSEQELSIKFASVHVGQYEGPLLFHFQKLPDRDSICIIKELIVYVEETERSHETIFCPFQNIAFNCNPSKLIPSFEHRKNSGVFLVPKEYKKLYANNLKLKDLSEEEEELVQDLSEIFQAGVTQENYTRYFHHLLWYEETHMKKNLRRYNMSNVELHHYNGLLKLFVPGLAEKRPSLMPGDIIYVKPHKHNEYVYEGVIAGTDNEYALIRSMSNNFNRFDTSGTFDIRFTLSRCVLERLHSAVNYVFEMKQSTRIFPRRSELENTSQPITSFFNPLVESNPEQRMAVEHIVAGTSGTAPYLVYGPPGTGKTVTIVEAIMQLVDKSEKNKIMVCADSNMVADNVAEMLLNYLPSTAYKNNILLRANSRYRPWETLPHCLRNYSNGTSLENYQPLHIKDFKEYQIVITTLSHAAKYGNDLYRLGYFPYITHLFIDEAGQSSEPACLIPVTGLLNKRGSLILCGDPMQLGPIVISQHVRRIGLGLSLMERLMKNVELYSVKKINPNYIVMLRNNFRSHADILEIPNELFYDGQLRVHAEEDIMNNLDIITPQVARSH